MKNLEYKDVTGGVEDIDAQKRVVTGYLSKFGNIDQHNDIMDEKAFNKTLSERKDDIFFLNQHNWQQPHGKFAELYTDSYGLKFVSNPLPDTSYSKDTLVLYEEGILKEHSVGFITEKDEYKDGVRTIKEVKLYEGSNVTLGANSQAIFTGLKSLSKQDIDDRVKSILKAFKRGNFTDDTFTLLEIALKELQMYSYELGKKALDEPLNNTRNEPQVAEINELFTKFKI